MKLSTISTLAALAAAFPMVVLAEPEGFDTPETAVTAVITALEAQDRDALIAIFGAENEDVILTGDQSEDRAIWSEFLSNYRSHNRISEEDDVATLYVGRTLWPFPVLMFREGDIWRFDAEEARDEILLRRIGANELDVIGLLRGYVQAQAAFRSANPDGDGLPSFASAILSSPGQRDGLYWPPEPGAPASPIGDIMARAAADGYSIDGADEGPEPYLGYYFRVLTRQGAAAPGGALDYMVGGHMLAGHALLALRGGYGVPGLMGFGGGGGGGGWVGGLGGGGGGGGGRGGGWGGGGWVWWGGVWWDLKKKKERVGEGNLENRK
jgi:hypothetical protein